MNFSEVIKENATRKYTENGARAYNTTGDKLLDLFSTVGSLRTRSEEEIREKYRLAFSEDQLLATKLLFYTGNIRGGLGERRTFRICLKWLAQEHPEIAVKNIPLVAAFNRWDSLFELIGTDVENAMWAYIAETFANDISNLTVAKVTRTAPHISLLAKWLPSENASSKKTRKLAKTVINKLRLSPKQYRQILSALRAQLKIVEKSMSAQEWDQIVYSGVPSYAMKNYRNAFERHDSERFKEFIGAVKKGEKKINASTLFPYDLIHQYTSRSGWDFNVTNYDEVLEQQWKALPNYVDEGTEVLVMADTSGSMFYGDTRPMETSVGLAIYFAQRNKGMYHNTFMTFSSTPAYYSIDEGASLRDCIRKVSRGPWTGSTNLTGAMRKILHDAVSNSVAPEEMPKALVVISDMEIDAAQRWGSDKWDYADALAEEFERAGYTMPKLIFWNVNSRNDTFLTKNKNTLLVSGQSPSTFRSVLKSINKTAYEAMLEVLNDPMYDCVRV